MKHGRNSIFIILAAAVWIISACGSRHGEQSENTDSLPEGIVKTSDSVSEASASLPAQLPSLNGVRSIKVRNLGALPALFNDTNALHLQAARLLGIDPVSDISSAYFTKRPLVKISSGELYQVDSLRHSLPYLVPEAAALLADIGRNFNDSLKSRGGDSYRIKVTSLLRTPASVEKLRKVNVNAADSSSHEYATTFDISWSNFYCLDSSRQINEGDLKNLLAEVLQDLREQGRCYVKFEKKTACFHVTARK